MTSSAKGAATGRHSPRRGIPATAAGGRYREVAFPDSGRGPHIDQAERFRAALAEHLAQA